MATLVSAHAKGTKTSEVPTPVPAQVPTSSPEDVAESKGPTGSVEEACNATYTLASLGGLSVVVTEPATPQSQKEFNKFIKSPAGRFGLKNCSTPELSCKGFERDWERHIVKPLRPDHLSEAVDYDFKIASHTNSVRHAENIFRKAGGLKDWLAVLAKEHGHKGAAQGLAQLVDSHIAPILAKQKIVERKLEIMLIRYNQNPNHPTAPSPMHVPERNFSGPFCKNLESAIKKDSKLRARQKVRLMHGRDMDAESFLGTFAPLVRWAAAFKAQYADHPYAGPTLHQCSTVLSQLATDSPIEIPPDILELIATLQSDLSVPPQPASSAASGAVEAGDADAATLIQKKGNESK